MSSLVPVATFSTQIDAELARSALEAAGIDSMIAADDAGGQRPHMSFSQGVVVMVREEDESAAREVLGEGLDDVDGQEGQDGGDG